MDYGLPSLFCMELRAFPCVHFGSLKHRQKTSPAAARSASNFLIYCRPNDRLASAFALAVAIGEAGVAKASADR